jgi:nucleoside-diphosphate-sugar epimerase
MSFLVTGGAGFSGSRLCESLLRSGHAVWAVDDLNAFYDPLIKRRNVSEIRALEGPFDFAEGDVTVYDHVYEFDVAMLRFFTVYGPRQRPDFAIHKFTGCIAAGQAIEVYGDGFTARDYSYITDILDGIMACTAQSFGFEIFNPGCSHPVALSRLIELLERALQKPAIIKRLSTQPGDVPRTWADISKSRLRLAYALMVKIEDGIALFLEWFDNYGDSSKNHRR